jgi:hypothetical protein
MCSSPASSRVAAFTSARYTVSKDDTMLELSSHDVNGLIALSGFVFVGAVLFFGALLYDAHSRRHHNPRPR